MAQLPHRRRVLLRSRTQVVVGGEPGLLVPKPDSHETTLSAVAYSASEVKQLDNPSLAQLAALRGTFPVVWLDVQGLGNAQLLGSLGETLGLHPLALEDVVNSNQRAKVEDYDDHLFVVLHRPALEQPGLSEQVSLFLGQGFVMTVREAGADPFTPVRERALAGRQRLCSQGADYLAYCLIDAVVDQFLPLLTEYAQRLDALELEAVANASRDTVLRLHNIGHELLVLRHHLGPLVEAVRALQKNGGPFVTDQTRLYLRDCLDHATRLSEELHTYRELSRGLVELCLSSLSASTNEAMRVLTIIATIFIPLSFIAGLYGMNFDHSASPWNMPELGLRFGYPLALGLMALTAVGLISYFSRKGWLKRGR